MNREQERIAESLKSKIFRCVERPVSVCLYSRLVGRALKAPPSLFALAHLAGKLWSISHQAWTPSGQGSLGGENLEMLRVKLGFSQPSWLSIYYFIFHILVEENGVWSAPWARAGCQPGGVGAGLEPAWRPCLLSWHFQQGREAFPLHTQPPASPVPVKIRELHGLNSRPPSK